MAAALALLAWDLPKNGYGNEYYAAAVRSMTDSWRNFVFGPVDPGGWITTDKPPMALWLGAVSARIFGFSSWSILLPQALAGTAAVGLLMGAVRRAWGVGAGRTAGIVLAVTPVFVAVSRVNNPDATLVLFMVAAAYAGQRAVTDERPGWLIVAGLCGGLAFLAKLLVAGLVMPGVMAAYLLAGPAGWARRIRDVVVASVAFAVVAGAWIVLVDWTPATSRPYVALSSNNTAQSLVFGAHGFGVLTGNESFGPGVNIGGSGLTAMLARLPGLGGTPGVARLFNAQIGDQVMWLAVPAALALVAGVVLAARRRLSRSETASVVIWGVWLLIGYVVFANIHGVFHDYYVSAIAPPLAALVGAGVAMARRSPVWGVAGLLVAIGGTAAIETVFLGRVFAYPWLRPVVPIGLGIVGAALVVVCVTKPPLGRGLLPAVIVSALVVALIAPTLWSMWAVRNGEVAAYASAGPPLRDAQRGGGSTGGLPFPGTDGSGLGRSELEWLQGQPPGPRWIVAVPSVLTAEGPIVAGYSVMPMAGFYGTDPAMTQSRLATLVANHELRFIDTGGFTLADPHQIDQLVAEACVHVDPALWHGTGTGTLYDCAGRAAAIRSIKPPADRGSVSGAIPGGIQLGPPAAVQRLVTCLNQHGWYPTSSSANPSTPAAAGALRACAQLLPAAIRSRPVPG
jgi:4-amino-4-deoxy-L-arabinose transferase-like glycosyltransferase